MDTKRDSWKISGRQIPINYLISQQLIMHQPSVCLKFNMAKGSEN